MWAVRLQVTRESADRPEPCDRRVGRSGSGKQTPSTVAENPTAAVSGRGCRQSGRSSSWYLAPRQSRPGPCRAFAASAAWRNSVGIPCCGRALRMQAACWRSNELIGCGGQRIASAACQRPACRRIECPVRTRGLPHLQCGAFTFAPLWPASVQGTARINDPVRLSCRSAHDRQRSLSMTKMPALCVCPVQGEAVRVDVGLRVRLAERADNGWSHRSAGCLRAGRRLRGR